MNTAKLEVEISYEQFENVVVTALEGGSNYWYLIDLDKVYQKHRKPKGLPTSVFLADLVWNKGYGLDVYDLESYDGDVEDIDQLGTLTREQFLAHAGDEPWALSELINDNLDATSADALFQLGTMGEIIFG